MKHDLEWLSDVGDDYLERVAPMIKISSEGNWPKMYPTRILERVQITQDLEAAKLRGDL